MSESYMAYQAAQAYRGASLTVSPVKAIVMLLEGCIMLIKKSMEATEAKRFEESHNHIVRTTTVLRGLSQHLNGETSGALGERLGRTYNALIMACLRSFGQPDSAFRYNRIIASLTELRDAWASVLASGAQRTP